MPVRQTGASASPVCLSGGPALLNRRGAGRGGLLRGALSLQQVPSLCFFSSSQFGSLRREYRRLRLHRARRLRVAGGRGGGRSGVLVSRRGHLGRVRVYFIDAARQVGLVVRENHLRLRGERVAHRRRCIRWSRDFPVVKRRVEHGIHGLNFNSVRRGIFHACRRFGRQGRNGRRIQVDRVLFRQGRNEIRFQRQWQPAARLR